jgi:hypothetical protein
MAGSRLQFQSLNRFMPELFVIEDDNDKLGIAIEVIDALNAQGDLQWVMPFNDLITKNYSDALESLRNSTDPFLIVDAEIRINDFENYQEAINDLRKFADMQGQMVFDQAYNEFKELFGETDDFQWSSVILAWANATGVPYMVISSRDNTDEYEPINTRAARSNVPFIVNWRPELRRGLDQNELNANRAVIGIGRKINDAYRASRGLIGALLWPVNALDERWFCGAAINPVIYHDYPSYRDNVYQNVLPDYLKRLLNAKTVAKIDQIAISSDLHESLKRIVGYCAIAHHIKGDKPATIEACALLAVAWDPKSASRFSEIMWSGTGSFQLLPDLATTVHSKHAILCFGGEDGLWSSLLIRKGAEPNERGEYTINDSTVESIKLTANQLRVNLQFDCEDLRSSLNAARGGFTATRLIAARRALKVGGIRICDLWFDGNTLCIGNTP